MRGMTTLLADTSYLSESPYGLWGIIMVIFLLAMLCYNAWLDDADARRRGYYVLAAALVLGILILFALHVWQVDPMELIRTHYYRRAGLLQPRSSFSILLFLSLGWIAAAWGIGYAVDKLIHRPKDEEEEEE